jgi:hypothetical protein
VKGNIAEDGQIEQRGNAMTTITTEDGTQIYCKDWGQGQPIVFSHGWPLSADDWDAQMLFFLNHGYRVIAHDRRGHGRSSQTGDGHDMDHYADDLAALTATPICWLSSKVRPADANQTRDPVTSRRSSKFSPSRPCQKIAYAKF